MRNFLTSEEHSRIRLLLAVLVLTLLVLFPLLGGRFYNVRNFTSMGFQFAEFGFLALAMTLVMIAGGIDLSVVANMNLASILGAMVMTNPGVQVALGEGGATLLAVVLIPLLSMSFGSLNVILINRISVPPILASLGTMIFFTGVAMAITGGERVGDFPMLFQAIGSTTVLGVPIPTLVLLLAFALIAYLLDHSAWGRSLYLYGENKIAALFAAIGDRRVVRVTYMLSGFLAGVAGIIFISRINSARVGYGGAYVLQAILVAVLGGTDPDGGIGKVWGVFLGIVVLQVLSTAFNLLQVTPYVRQFVWGSMLLLVMALSHVLAIRRQNREVLRQAEERLKKSAPAG